MRIAPDTPHDGEVWCVVPADFRSQPMAVFTTRDEAVAELAGRPGCHAYHFLTYDPGRTLRTGGHDRLAEREAEGLRRQGHNGG
jgi:hypothetical protein